MPERSPLQHPRIPLGCDQQGRYPEAAEAATEVGADDDPPANWWIAMAVDIGLAFCVVMALYIILRIVLNG